MAGVWPFSQRTVELLSRPPAAGETHVWLARAACGVRSALPRERCAAFLREVCRRWVSHRAVPEREILAAVALAYDADAGRGPQTTASWPEVNRDAVAACLGRADVPLLFDPAGDTGIEARDALYGLFRPGELVCGGWICERPVVQSVERWAARAGSAQFVVSNPMRGPTALTKEGKPSARCQANVAARRWIVAEFDGPDADKRAQAKLASVLARGLPLKMAVDSGGKSLHCWYACEGRDEREAARFFWAAVALGADATRWDTCGWVRMPGGVRRKDGGAAVKQKVVYWREGEVTLNVQRSTLKAEVGSEAGNG